MREATSCAGKLTLWARAAASALWATLAGPSLTERVTGSVTGGDEFSMNKGN
jgi:hypothetical protein